MHRLLLSVRGRRSHHAGHTRWQVHHLPRDTGGWSRGRRQGGFEWRGSLGQVRVPLWDHVVGHLVQPAADELKGLGAQDAVEKADGVQDPGHARVDDVEVVGHPRGNSRGAALGSHLVRADLLHQVTCVDLDRALLLAHAIGSARVQAIILIRLLHLLVPLLLHRGGVGERVQAVHLAEHSDALARSEGEILRRAVALAEAALDAPVHDGGGSRRCLQVLHVQVGVPVQHHARVDGHGGVKQVLQLPHQLVGLCAPLHLHKGCHIAACAVLALQAATVLSGHDVAHLLHHVCKALHLCLVAETLREHQVQVALQGVPEAGCIVISVVLEHLNQVNHHIAQLVHRASHILNQHGGSPLTSTTHDGNKTLAEVPEHLGVLHVPVELVVLNHLGILGFGPQGKLAACKAALDLINALLQRLVCLPSAFN
mmetsp:Transcript_14411/g.39045  ORF Transcript_14411/g.39045 Transcript_14411/m.39045 type:complete len:426 (+) Transcript_14411:1091-2368(+)